MNIKEYLKKNNITIASLQKNTNIPYTTISELINGKVDVDRVYVGSALKLSAACNLSFEAFYALCKKNTDTEDTNVEIKIRNKKYYVSYTIEGDRQESYLFKASSDSKRFVKDAAKWEFDIARQNKELEREISEVESWTNSI